MSDRDVGWVCCQLGAREHYAVPRALHRVGKLAQLVTDAWMPAGRAPGWLRASACARLGQRYHQDLASATVRSFTGSFIAHEGLWRAGRRRGWDAVLARNRWFQVCAAKALPARHQPTMLFAHSYSAQHILREGQHRGWTRVLGQIDAGPEHYALLERLTAQRPEYGSGPPLPEPEYFRSWRAECELANWIVVNSDWSRQSLVRAGVDATKITIVPLPFEPEAGAAPARAYPEKFSTERPLRALFVGTASVMKGVPELLEAFALLADPRLELCFVGDRTITIPSRFARHPRIRWIGPVDRATVMAYYQSSDVLLFPSHSDGFGMVQVEAQGWALPIIASRHCGQVVRDGQTGLVLPEVTAAEVAAALRRALDSPEWLDRWSRAMRTAPAPGLAALASGLTNLEPR